MRLNPAIAEVLAPAYGPCPELKGACSGMRWCPEGGHVPRGFCGAAGSLGEIELVLVFAEPGDPHPGEVHTGLHSTYEYAARCFCDRKDRFHKNVREILNGCWRGMEFEEQMRKTWLVDSVLCSASKECGSVPRNVALACGQRYLLHQLSKVSSALVVAMGGKAQRRLRALGVHDFLPAYSVAPPGCNFKGAKKSWERIPRMLKRRKG